MTKADMTWEYPSSTLVRVKDGDTFVAKVSRTIESDFGFHIKETTTRYAEMNFRLNRLACAKSTTPSGTEATKIVQFLLTQGAFNLTSVGPYKYGDEWMAEVVLFDGTNVSDYMIAHQYGVFWNGVGAQPIPPWPRTVA